MKPPPGVAASAIFVLASGYRVLLEASLPPILRVPASLGVAGGTLALARADGATGGETGLDPHRLGTGLRWGLAAASLATPGIAAAVLLAPRRLLRSAAAIPDADRGVVHETVIRIPLGTALFEEAVFRGAMLAVLQRRWGFQIAAAVTSGLFGIWHVLPMRSHHGGFESRIQMGKPGAAISIAVTTSAGLVLAWLRRRSGSLLAPTLVHGAVNATAFALTALRLRDRVVPLRVVVPSRDGR